MSDVTLIDKCRLCGSSELFKFVHYPNVPLANCYLEDGKKAPRFDLTLVVCKECDCHQLKQNVDPNILFGDYYAYSTPPSLSSHFESFAGTVVRDLNLNDKSVVVDIGGNNGTLCSYFKQLTPYVINIEPSKNIAEESRKRGIDTLCEFFGEGLLKNRPVVHRHNSTIREITGGVDVAVSANVFAHSPEVFDMMKGVKMLLKRGGVFVQENASWASTFNNRDLGQIYHEHYFYHDIHSLYKAYERLGMTLYHVEYNNAQCGSFRIYVKNYPNYPLEDSLGKMSLSANNGPGWSYWHKTTKESFAESIKEIKNKTIAFLEKNKNKKIGLVGVPAKIALIIDHFGLEKYIFAAYEDAPLKVGKQVPGTNINIKSMEELRECNIFLMGAYNFADSIIERFSDIQTEWCVLLPEFRVYDSAFRDSQGRISRKYDI